ncbi:MAG: arylsulfatase [Nocardioides sp.]|nr:arylsulfatase [Nocardioides sp.]
MPSTDHEGAVIGRTFADSTPAFPEPDRARPGAPNVLYVLYDDLGWADFGCFGSEISTPTVDRLAAEGLRYTNFHVTPLCSPTRASLLTGRNHHATGMGLLPNFALGYPGYRGQLHHTTATIGEMAQAQGYTTLGVGKWHLTPMNQFTGAGPFDQWPLRRGFDRFYGTPDGMTNQWRPDLIEDNHWVDTPERPGYHFTEDIVDKAIDYVRDHRNGDAEKPFFLYVAFCAPHFPHHVAREYVDKYVPVFEKGWDATRADRLARQKELGLVPPDTELPPRNPGVRAWDEYSPEDRAAMVRLQAAYAGMVEHTDEHLGRLVAALEAMGELDNTLVVLCSDNGASQEGGEVGSMNAMKFFFGYESPEEELRVVKENQDAIGWSPDFINTYAVGWSMAGNTPLKRWKQDTHAGGVRSPLVVRYPGEIPDPGGIRTQFHHAIDITPTALDVTGMTAPSQVGGVEQEPLHGESLRYTFAQPEAPTVRTVQYFEMNGQRAIWQDGWKAVTHHEPMLSLELMLTGDAGKVTDFEADRWELYHVDEDWNELHDLAEQEPERLAAMVERWWVEAEKYDVLPLGAAIGGMNGPPITGRYGQAPPPEGP